jgi:hypothetical protein
VVFTENKFPLKSGKEIDTLDILEEETINSDEIHDFLSQPVNLKKRATTYRLNQHWKAALEAIELHV